LEERFLVCERHFQRALHKMSPSVSKEDQIIYERSRALREKKEGPS